jgi:hypothetical protein
MSREEMNVVSYKRLKETGLCKQVQNARRELTVHGMQRTRGLDDEH